VLMVWLPFLHYTSLCISCDKNLGEFLMLCFVLWALCCSFLSIKIYVCTWVDLLFVNSWGYNLKLQHMIHDECHKKLKMSYKWRCHSKSIELVTCKINLLVALCRKYCFHQIKFQSLHLHIDLFNYVTTLKHKWISKLLLLNITFLL
jgi:hypothetical protein